MPGNAQDRRGGADHGDPRDPARGLYRRAVRSDSRGMDDRELSRIALCAPFPALGGGEIRSALERVNVVVRTWRAGETIARAGESWTGYAALLTGEARAEMINDEGRTFVVETFHAPAAIATAILFSPERLLPVSLVAVSDSRIAAIPRDQFLRLCASDAGLLEELLGDMGARLSFLAERLRATQFATLRERFADWLVRRSELRDSPDIRLDSGRERLAELFGVARPSLSREIGALVRRGLIEARGREIRILDMRGLRDLRMK